MIRSGRGVVHRPHQRRLARSPGVSDALADALGLTVEGVLDAGGRRARPGQVGGLRPRRSSADAVREAMFAAGAGHIGDYSHCSWSVTGTGQFLPHDGASPDDRHRRHRRAGGRGPGRDGRSAPRLRGCARGDAGRAPLRGARLRRLRAGSRSPADVGLGRIGTLPSRRPLATFVSRVHAALPATSWGVRAVGRRRRRGVAGRGVRWRRRLAARRGRGRRGATPTSPPTCVTIPPTSTAAPPTSRWSTSRTGPASTRGALRRPSCCATTSVTRYRCRCHAVRTDPWNVERSGT